MDNKRDIKEAVKILTSIVKVNNDYLKNVKKQTINQREIQAIENILEDRERLEKIIKEMINVIKHYDIDLSGICYKRFVLCDKCEKTIEECIKQYFEKKAEGE